MCFSQLIYGDDYHDIADLRRDEILFFLTHTFSTILVSSINPVILIL